jgi:radical SAM protein with 4Fe4S-binding SPASM domain
MTKILGKYNWQDRVPSYVPLEQLNDTQKHRLMESETFCMLPWIHLHAWPDGRAYPCCLANGQHPVGNFKEKTMREVWNDTDMREMRLNMLSDKSCKQCSDCYEQEAAGFASMRNNSNKNFAQHMNEVEQTRPDGSLPDMRLHYWDVRFSNICNLKCRSCGSIFSSRWYDDDVKLWGRELRPRVSFAGRHDEDIWEQMQEHVPHLDQIYFAGGEPLIMEEHTRILKLLIEKGNTGVRLIYNTNFTHTDLKGRSVFEYWKQFKSVAVGASLDGMGHAAEYIRKGTRWYDVVQNRHRMIATCPNVDFYISPTLSIMNAWHLPDFHKEWVSAGLIRAQDLNVNILQDPAYYRIDIAPAEYKQRLEAKYLKHLDWMSDRDPLQRATQGFRSAITFMNASDNTQLIDTFWRKTHELDSIRNESWHHAVPELEALK